MKRIEIEMAESNFEEIDICIIFGLWTWMELGYRRGDIYRSTF